MERDIRYALFDKDYALLFAGLMKVEEWLKENRPDEEKMFENIENLKCAIARALIFRRPLMNYKDARANTVVLYGGIDTPYMRFAETLDEIMKKVGEANDEGRAEQKPL